MSLTDKLKSGIAEVPPFTHLVAAVSGGADSVVLAHALKQTDYSFTIAHLNHQLRGEASDGDELFVQEFAKKLGVKCITEKAEIPKEGNLEQNARTVRYDFLERVRQSEKADFIAVAHHADDQAETVLMHIARGAGLRGQIGMRPLSGKIIRPMLGIKRQEILDYAGQENLKYREDQSNSDLSYDRNFWRHLVLPYIKKDIPHFNSGIADLSRKASARLETVSRKAERWLTVNMNNNQFSRGVFNKLPYSVKSEILIRILGAEDLYSKTLDQVIQFISTAHSGRKITFKDKAFLAEYDIISVLVQNNLKRPLYVIPAKAGIQLSNGGTLDSRLRGNDKRERGNDKVPITKTGIRWGGWRITSKTDKPLYVRRWKPGDRFQPSGMKGTKKLQDFFTDQKIPLRARHEIPVIVNEKDDIMAVGDLRFSNEGREVKDNIIIINDK